MTLRETDEVAALYAGARRILDADYGDGRRIGDSKTGGYLSMTMTASRFTVSGRKRRRGAWKSSRKRDWKP